MGNVISVLSDLVGAVAAWLDAIADVWAQLALAIVVVSVVIALTVLLLSARRERHDRAMVTGHLEGDRIGIVKRPAPSRTTPLDSAEREGDRARTA